MKFGLRKLQMLAMAALLPAACCFAQKVTVGYDKAADFSKYKSFTLRKPVAPPSRTLLYASVMSRIASELASRGVPSVEQGGDLTVIATGGFDYGLASNPDLLSDSCSDCKAPLVDPMDWTGKLAAPGPSGMALPKGTLKVTLVNRATNKVVWSGTVSQKVDPQKPDEALQKVDTAVKKLMWKFPPKR
jgi:hypothetical protein